MELFIKTKIIKYHLIKKFININTKKYTECDIFTCALNIGHMLFVFI